MSNGAPSSLADVRMLAERMSTSAVDAVQMAGQLSAMVNALGPDRGATLSRYRFDRASLWSLGVSFENVLPDEEAPSKVIRFNRDVWIRGVQAQGYQQFSFAEIQPTIDDLIEQEELWRCIGSSRNTFENAWRIDDRQGFISQGQSEILAPAATITGDGFFPVPLDWRLEREQSIEVRLRSRMLSIFPSTGASPVTFNNDVPLPAAARVLRWVVVTFWAEEIDNPSIR